jgi:hypothetical protein
MRAKALEPDPDLQTSVPQQLLQSASFSTPISRPSFPPGVHRRRLFSGRRAGDDAVAARAGRYGPVMRDKVLALCGDFDRVSRTAEELQARGAGRGAGRGGGG